MKPTNKNIYDLVDREMPKNAANDLPLGTIFAHELGDEYSPPDEIVEGVLTAGASSVIYGDSNSGKTFFAIDLACALARGVDWMGRKTQQGLIVYVAAESPVSVRARLQAYQAEHECKVPNFAIVQHPVNLFDNNADTDSLIFAVKDLERHTGLKCILIVGDTLARMTAGSNENSGEDMGIVVRHFDHIRSETGAHFALIHHTGKDSAKGARGHSSLRAAVDCEIEITDSPAGRCAEITKQRDLPTKGERIGFSLKQVTLGVTKWGKPATSCVVEPTAAPTKTAKARRMGEVEGAVFEFLRGLPAGVKISQVAKHFEDQYARGSVYRAIDKLNSLGMANVAENSRMVSADGGCK